tara:strand:+ start:2479 stop:2799 length:321 start_codon:yes stop_codon:yes gene_type:complete
MSFAAGKHAFGFCDRCGFRYPLSELVWEMEDKRRNGLRVCMDACLTPDHPQLQLGRTRIFDPQTLRDPRPDLAKVDSQSLFGFNPVGAAFSTAAKISVGSVSILTT